MKNKVFRKSLIFALILALISMPVTALAATNAQKVLPNIKSFTVSNQNVAIGDTVVLSWDVENATSIQILGLEKQSEDTLPLCGSLEAWPMDTTSYVLIATGCGGTVSSSVTVNVDKTGDAAVEYFTASSTKVVIGSTVVLSWKTSNVTNVEITGLEKTEEDQLPLTGSVEVWPMETTTYILQATGKNGEVVSKALTVNIVESLPAVINSFTASKSEIYAGDTVKLEWDVEDAVIVKLNGAEVAPVGTMNVTPNESTIYTLTALGTDGVEEAVSISVKVLVGPKITSFTASETTVTKGKLVTLSWTTENATSCAIITDDGVKLTNRPLNGKISVTPNKTRTYTLVAYNNDQVTAQQSITITVK